MPVSAREAACAALAAYRRSGAWSELALDSAIGKAGLDKRDAALATRLCMGVLQNMMLLDWHIQTYSAIKLDKLQPQVLDVLRFGAYQLLFMDRVPASAAVNESVELARKRGNIRAAGFVNAVLRKIAAESGSPNVFTGGDVCETLSVRYSHPLWLTRRFVELFGTDGAERLLAANNAPVPTTVQINTIISSAPSTKELLDREYIEYAPHEFLENCLQLRGASRIEATAAYRLGAIYVQDAAARTAVEAAAIKPGDAVIDCCAAPGGKSFAAAVAMQNCGRIISCDIHENKLRRISSGASRLGIGIIGTRCADARAHDTSLEDAADVVIADVPCSGLGVIRKKPEIRYKKESELAALPPIQLAILQNVSGYVRPGGVLLYSTCTLLPEENGDVVSAFLASRGDFFAEPFKTPFGASKTGMMTLLPHVHGTDGFFICKLIRRE